MVQAVSAMASSITAMNRELLQLRSRQEAAPLAQAAKPAPASQSYYEKFLAQGQEVVDKRLYFEPAAYSYSRLRLAEMYVVGFSRKARTLKSDSDGNLVLEEDEPEPLTDSDAVSYEKCVQGMRQLLKFIRSSEKPEIRALFADREKFIEEFEKMPDQRACKAKFLRHFLRKYRDHDDWCSALDTDGRLQHTYLRSPLADVSNSNRGSNSAPKKRPRSRSRDRGSPRRSSPRKRTPSRKRTSPSKRLANFCYSVTKKDVGKCTHKVCRYDHRCPMGCRSGHPASECPKFDADRCFEAVKRRREDVAAQYRR